MWDLYPSYGVGTIFQALFLLFWEFLHSLYMQYAYIRLCTSAIETVRNSFAGNSTQKGLRGRGILFANVPFCPEILSWFLKHLAHQNRTMVLQINAQGGGRCRVWVDRVANVSRDMMCFPFNWNILYQKRVYWSNFMHVWNIYSDSFLSLLPLTI